MKPLYIVDEFAAIVDEVNTAVLTTIQQKEANALGTSKIERVNYQYGGYEELLETLAQKDTTKASRTLKYPLVFLQMDFVERRRGISGFYAEVSPRILIIHQTVNTYKITDRYTKVFKPVLYPIYYEFLNQIALYTGIVESNPETIEHDKTDMAFVGRNSIGNGEGTLLNDYVDAIDISNLTLKFYIKTC